LLRKWSELGPIRSVQRHPFPCYRKTYSLFRARLFPVPGKKIPCYLFGNSLFRVVRIAVRITEFRRSQGEFGRNRVPEKGEIPCYSPITGNFRQKSHR
jgi:hypothetical protein